MFYIIKSYTFNDFYTQINPKKTTLFKVDYFPMYKTAINILKNVTIWSNHGKQTA